MARMLHEEQGLAEIFVTHLLSRNIRYEADLVDQFFNSSEMRLAQILCCCPILVKESKTQTVVPGINHENLAQMVGTTRSRINYFMNKFAGTLLHRCSTTTEITVHSGLLNVVRHPANDSDYDK